MTQKSAEKWKNKMWFNVYPPKLLGEAPIGEIPADDEKNVVGRVMKVSMAWITHRAEHSFMIIALRVVKVSGNSAATDLKFVEQTYSYIHSLVRRHSSAVYTVDNLTDKNGRKYVLKLLAVTTTKIRTPKKTAIRKVIGNYANEFSSAHSVDEVLSSILDNSFRGEIVKRVTHIAPLSKFELKKIEL